MVPTGLEGDFCRITGILAQSDRHRSYTLACLERLVVPPIELGQYFLWQDIYISWAFLSDEAQRGYIDGTRKIWPSDWDSGNNAWVIDVVSREGGTARLHAACRHIWKQYPGVDKINFRRWYPGRPRRYSQLESSHALFERAQAV